MTQKKALEILQSGANVFLTGQPGSGKTYVVNQFTEWLNNRGIFPAVTASTGIAATHIGGVTLHSWSGIGIAEQLSASEIVEIAGKWWIEKKIKNCKVLIIDEVSMLPANVLDNVEKIIQQVKRNELPFGGIQVVLVGDLFQLPPVTKRGQPVNFVYKGEAWNTLNLKYCVIEEQHRQDDMMYLEILTAMRNGKLKDKHILQLKKRLAIKKKPITTKLFTHNEDVDNINITELRKLKTELYTFGIEEGGEKNLIPTLKRNCLSPEILKLKVGALVMFTRNNFDDGYVNGTLGEVIGFEGEYGAPIVRVSNGDEIAVKYAEWSIKEFGEVKAWIKQLPLRLAWAMTVHKSQGMSLDSAIIDLGKAFEYGQGYVALSRVKSLSGLFLEGLNDHSLLMHPEIVEKDKEFIKASHSHDQA